MRWCWKKSWLSCRKNLLLLEWVLEAPAWIFWFMVLEVNITVSTSFLPQKPHHLLIIHYSLNIIHYSQYYSVCSQISIIHYLLYYSVSIHIILQYPCEPKWIVICLRGSESYPIGLFGFYNIYRIQIVKIVPEIPEPY